ncbi:MAG TPA: hypothetical protein VE775_09760 [Pyrinomonadaceae bacterium]|nr:hypothetical protein [Pyrinomonadaceae bacterium]
MTHASSSAPASFVPPDSRKFAASAICKTHRTTFQAFVVPAPAAGYLTDI